MTVVALSICGTAGADPLAERTYAQPRSADGGGAQSAPVPERTYSGAPSSAVPEAGDSGALDAPAAAVAPAAASPDGGLGALAIVLISIGGGLALAAVAYTGRRLLHHAHPVA